MLRRVIVLKKIDSLLLAIDAWILGICTKFTHHFQRTTGLTNYFPAKVGVAFVFIEIMISIMNYFHRFLELRDSS